MDLFAPIREFAKSQKPVSFAISCGKDSAVMLDLVARFLGVAMHRFFYFSSYPQVLPFRARYLQALERKYRISVEIRYQPRSMGLRQAPAFERIRQEHGTDYVGLGYKIYDSLQRRAILKDSPDGIVERARLFCPLRDWTNRQAMAYAKGRKLVLAPDYSMGCQCELDDFCGPRAVVLRHLISEEDFQCAARQDKRIQIDYERFKDHPEYRELAERKDRQGDALPDRG